MVGNTRNARLDELDEELSDWPSSVVEQGAWVRFTDEQPPKRLPVQEIERPVEPRPRAGDEWFVGGHRRHHSDPGSQPKPVDRLVPELFLNVPTSEELAYEEQVTVAMFAKRPSQPTRTGPTREELYREAQRLGLAGRSKMNKEQLAQALEELLGEPTQSD